MPSWADGGEPAHTGALDVFSGDRDRAQLTEVYVDGELAGSSPYQSAFVGELPDGESEWRVVNTATHDGSYLRLVDVDGHRVDVPLDRASDDYTEQILPMMQAYYDVDPRRLGQGGRRPERGEPGRARGSSSGTSASPRAWPR